MAFVVAAGGFTLRVGRGGSLSTNFSRTSVRVPRRARLFCTATPDGSTGSTVPAASETEESKPYEVPTLDLDGEAVKDRVMSMASDVGARPAYYGKVVAYISGALVALTIVRAVVSAVDAIPVLPSVLELIGLGYTSWFIWRYVLFKESREELMEEIEDLVGRARPSSE